MVIIPFIAKVANTFVAPSLLCDFGLNWRHLLTSMPLYLNICYTCCIHVCYVLQMQRNARRSASQLPGNHYIWYIYYIQKDRQIDRQLVIVILAAAMLTKSSAVWLAVQPIHVMVAACIVLTIVGVGMMTTISISQIVVSNERYMIHVYAPLAKSHTCHAVLYIALCLIYYVSKL